MTVSRFLYAVLGIGFLVGAAGVALLVWVARSSRSTAYAGILLATIAIVVGAAGYLACLIPQIMRYCIHAGALSSRSAILIALGSGALVTSLAFLACSAIRSTVGRASKARNLGARQRGE